MGIHRCPPTPGSTSSHGGTTTGLRSTAAGIGALVTATGAHPMHTMLLADEAFVLAATGAGVIDADIALAARAAAVRALGPAFEETWRSPPIASQSALLALARDASSWSSPGTHVTKGAMDTLLDRGIIDRAARGRYRCVEALLRDFVANVT